VRIGLRGRLVLVLILVGAITLATAAWALLAPLGSRLDADELQHLTEGLQSERGLVTDLPSGALAPGDPQLRRAVSRLRRRVHADVAVFSENGQELAGSDPDALPGDYRAVPAARRTGEPQAMITGGGENEQADVAIPVRAAGRRLVLAARTPTHNIQRAEAVVNRAFAAAAGGGLAVALLAGVLLAGRLSRRLRRLRDTALRVAEGGPEAEFVPDGGRDEIGELSAAFATMQRRLREQEDVRRAFVANASHELRTPLTSLQMMLGLLLDDLDAQPPAITDARAQAIGAERQAERLSQLSADLLDLSRIDAGVELRSEPVSLDGVLRSVVAEFAARLTEEGRGIAIDGSRDCVAIADPGSVAQILRALVDNALGHGAGDVRVTVASGAATVSVSVCDAGPGVSVAERERVFQRFARGQQAHSGGFGLGLAIARELARRMGGELRIADGRSAACFELTLTAG